MHKKLGIFIFAILLLAFPIATFLTLPKEAQPFSENENRYLSEFPKASVTTIKDETFMDGFDDWFSDRFYGRETWITARNTSEKLMGKTEIDTVYTKDDQMLQVLSAYDDIGAAYDEDKIDTNIGIIDTFAKNHADVPVYVMLAPTSIGIYGDSLLSAAVANVSVNEADMIASCYAALQDVTPIDITDALANHSDEYIYYRTDHHWTSLGAYYAYQAAGSILSYAPYALSDFTKETVSDSFQGTLFSKTLDDSVTKDCLDFYTLKDGGAITMQSSNGYDETTDYDSIFCPAYLDVKDKYSAFTGENAAIVTITNDDDSVAGRSLLIIKDSYANSMIQFLATNYETITMIDLRYTNQTVTNLVNVSDFDQVLFLYNCITFSDEDNLIQASY